MSLFVKKSLSSLVTLVLLLTLLGGCAGEQAIEPLSDTRLMLDTFCSITIYDVKDRVAMGQAFELCAEYESLLSITLEGSDIWRINHAGGEPVVVEPQTLKVIEAGLRYGELSGGRFDITIGALSRLWDFGGGSGVPMEEDIARTRGTVDYMQLAVEGNTVRLANPEAWIDLGGIAKGYIADVLANFLREQGVSAAIIDLGGNVVVVGEKPDGSPWKIGVRKPFGESSEYIGVVRTAEASIVSSGTYERRFVEDGEAYHHILDPFTGYPAVTDIVGVSVVSESSMDGDALSTITVLSGSENAREILSTVPGVIGAVIILENGEVISFGDIDFS